MYLKANEAYTVEELLYGLLLASVTMRQRRWPAIPPEASRLSRSL